MTLDSQTTTDLPQPRFSERRERVREQAISYLMHQAVENPDCISLAAGLVDPSSLPVEETRAVLESLVGDEDYARKILQYGTTQGSATLRSHLVEHIARMENRSVDELGIDASQLILTTGSQQLLSLVAEMLLDPGDICLVAAPTYFVFLGVLHGVGARVIPVPSDDNGMQMDALESELERLDEAGELHRVKLIYLVSFFENPSGVSLSAERRSQAVDLARRWSRDHRIFILEDAAYRELCYDGPELPSAWSFDTTRETVILAHTFSKSFSPGLRVGFGVVPDELLEPLCERKGNEDFGSANFNQHLIAKVFEQGLYESHVEKVRASYRNKRDCMLAAADEHFSELPGVSWVHPHGGLYVWMSLPESIETGFESPLFHQATQVEKIMYVPGEICYAGPLEQRARNQMRLSFGVETPGGIEQGMHRLARAIRAVL